MIIKIRGLRVREALKWIHQEPPFSLCQTHSHLHEGNPVTSPIHCQDCGNQPLDDMGDKQAGGGGRIKARTTTLLPGILGIIIPKRTSARMKQTGRC